MCVCFFIVMLLTFVFQAKTLAVSNSDTTAGVISMALQLFGISVSVNASVLCRVTCVLGWKVNLNRVRDKWCVGSRVFAW